MKRRSWLWFIASAVLAILAGVLAIVVLRGAMDDQQVVPTVPKQPVVIARQPLAANTVIRADYLVVEERDEIDSGAVVSVSDVLGLRTLRDIAQGEQILMQYVTRNITESLRIIPDDRIAVALPANDILSQWGAVLPGDHVDVLFTLDVVLETPVDPEDVVLTDEGQFLYGLERDQSLDNVSVLTLQNLEVLQILEEPRIGTEDEQEAPTTPPSRALVLEIDPQDAVVLKYLRDSVGRIDLALRSQSNNTLFETQPVNINYLVLRYGIVLPEPLE